MFCGEEVDELKDSSCENRGLEECVELDVKRYRTRETYRKQERS